MANIKDGILGAAEGPIGPVEGYKRRGVGILRAKRRKTTAKPSLSQLICRQNMYVVNEFIGSMTDFVRVGFDLEAAPTTKTANNLAKSYQMYNALTGEYPNIKLDFSKARVTSGKLRPADNPAVTVNGDLLTFTWDIVNTWPDWSDMVMLVAHAPALKQTCYDLSGAKRIKGTEDLAVRKSWKGEVVETYISFRSADGKGMANSVYVGSIIY